MLVKFSIDSEIFKLKDDLDNFDKHFRLIDLWRDCGIFVIQQTKETDSSLLIALKNTSPRISNLWKAALKNYRKTTSKINLESAISRDIFPNKSEVNLALLSIDETKAAVWDIEDDIFSKITPDKLEIIKFGFEHRSECFISAKNLCASPIKQGTTFSQFWGERLSLLSQESKNITVCDRYLLDNFITRDNNSAFEELIAKLARLNSDNKKILTIYTSGRAKQGDDDDNFKYECYAYVNYIKEFSSVRLNSE
jgi:hypothetical protein